MNKHDLMARYLRFRKEVLYELAVRLQDTKRKLKEHKSSRPLLDKEQPNYDANAALTWLASRSNYDRSVHYQMLNIKEKRGMTIKQWALIPLDPRLGPIFNVVKEAKVLQVARTEGMDAAILWKLQNGGAQ